MYDLGLILYAGGICDSWMKRAAAMNLPPDVQLIAKAHLLIWRPRGVLDEAKTEGIIAFLAEEENKLGRSFDRFTDLSVIDAFDLSFKFVFHVALYRRIARLGREPVKSAFLVTSEAVARYVKLHAVLTDHSPLHVKMFEDRDAAAAWLDVTAELLAPADE